LAKAYTDQLERKSCQVSTLRTQIAAAEKASGAARNTALNAAIAAADAAKGCDSKKADLLKKALQDLMAPAM
jgi:ABC-type sulfate transport system substrate-binding protein